MLAIFFFHFLKFGALVFSQIAWSDSLEQCLATSRGKSHEKNFQMGQNIGPKIRFFCRFLKFGSLVFLELA